MNVTSFDFCKHRATAECTINVGELPVFNLLFGNFGQSQDFKIKSQEYKKIFRNNIKHYKGS